MYVKIKYVKKYFFKCPSVGIQFPTYLRILYGLKVSFLQQVPGKYSNNFILMLKSSYGCRYTCM